MSLPYIFLCFPRDKRLTVYQQIEANEHARYMYQFMEQRREQFKIQQHVAPIQMFNGQHRPNRCNRRRRQRKNQQPKNAEYQPINQAPVKAAKPIISQCQPKYQQPSRQVPIQAKPQPPVKAATKPIINHCQPKHQQSSSQNQSKKSTKVPSNRKTVDSGVGSSLNSGNRSPVELVPNPFYTAPQTTCKPIVSPTGVKLVPNPFYQCPV